MNAMKINLTIAILTAAAGLLFGQQKQAMEPAQPLVADTASADTAAGGQTGLPLAPAVSGTEAEPGRKTTDSTKPADPVLLLKTSKDTVLLISNESEVHKILANVSANVKKSRMQGYGGGGGFSNRIVAFDMGPVAELMAESYPGIFFPSLDYRFKALNMSGGLGYAGLGNGVRLGGGGYGGSCKFVSRPYTAAMDSSMTLKVDIHFGGLLIEKAFIRENWNIYAGSFLGGGSIELQKAVGKSSAFSSGLNEPSKLTRAGLMSLEFHGGATYTIVSWMHVGGDVNLVSYFASNGFEWSSSGSFYGIMPGFGIRVIFGNIG